MKKIFIVLAGIVLLLPFSTGCSGITGSGNLETRSFNNTDFTQIEALHGFQVTVVRADSFSVELTTDDNIQDYISVSQSGDTLRLSLSGADCIPSSLRARITMPDISGINLSGGSQANISGFNSTNVFSATLSDGSVLEGSITSGDIGVSLSGGSQVSLDGSAGDLLARSSGGSQMMLENFPINNADINVDAGGKATINISGKIDATLTGGSEVLYIGEPEMGEINISGGSTLMKKQ
jgi:hypothetical protein